MKRPLFWVCICLALLITVWTSCFDAPPFRRDEIVEEGVFVTVKGQIYQKEVSSIYLKSIEIIYQDTGQVSKINPRLKIICEYKEGNPKLQLGRVVCVSGIWKSYTQASNPGQFDYVQYYALEGIMGKMQNCIFREYSDSYWPLREKLSAVRNYFKDRIYEALPKKEASILAKMILGEKSGIDKEIRELYRKNGIVHILSISGLHITMIGMGIYRGLRKCSCTIVPSAVAGTVFLLLYGTMTGFGVSTYRAIGMYIIHILGEVVGRSYDLLTAMSIMLVTILVHDPRMIYHCGFLLSFGSVLAVGGLYKVLPLQEAVLKKRAVQPPLIICFLLKRCGGLLQGLWASTSISAVTLPIMLYFYYEIPIYAPLVNVLILPFVGVVMLAGFGLMFFPGFRLLAQTVHIILGGYERICLLSEKLPGHTWVVGRPEMWKIVVYYVMIALIVWLCNEEEEVNERNKFVKGIPGIKKSKWWLCCVMVPILILGIRLHREDAISFLDVGQGDCVVVMTQTGKTFMFDAGSSSVKNAGEDIIHPFLAYHGINKIDGVFLSHPDQDHMNGILQLLESESIKIECIYLPDVAEVCKVDFEILFRLAEEAERNHQIFPKIEYYSAGDYLKEGTVCITCLHPEEGYLGGTNAYSGCFEVEGFGWKALLTGDVEAEGEEALINQLEKNQMEHVQVLKVSHHGSKYATGKEFLKTITAQLAVISCGEENSYGHPHRETIERLENSKIPYCITWQKGCITVTKDGYCFYKR